jgi:hypothetical protein
MTSGYLYCFILQVLIEAKRIAELRMASKVIVSRLIYQYTINLGVVIMIQGQVSYDLILIS